MKHLDEAAASEYAGWFQCLADGTRLRILNIVAAEGGPMTVGEVVDRVGKSQSTVSKHLQILADGQFVLAKPDGVRTMVSVNEACMTALPEAASNILARTGISSR